MKEQLYTANVDLESRNRELASKVHSPLSLSLYPHMLIQPIPISSLIILTVNWRTLGVSLISFGVKIQAWMLYVMRTRSVSMSSEFEVRGCSLLLCACVCVRGCSLLLCVCVWMFSLLCVCVCVCVC